MIGQPVLQNHAYSPTIGLLIRYSRVVPERLASQARDRVQTFGAITWRLTSCVPNTLGD